MEVMRPSARQADMMIVSGTVTKKMVPQIVRLYNQMPEPKYVVAMGACASGGGPFKEGYNVVSAYPASTSFCPWTSISRAARPPRRRSCMA
jgi:NADH:ubiquinone oxidoreductase subunit B-like Fe-S oxidoreductase